MNRKKTIFGVWYQKQACLDHKNIGFKNPQNLCFFFKELVHGFGPKFQILLNFSFIKKIREKLFADVIVWKEVFLDDRNRDLKERKIDIIAKVIVHDFGQKVEIFFFCVFLKNWWRKSVFDILDRKEACKDHKSICL